MIPPTSFRRPRTSALGFVVVSRSAAATRVGGLPQDPRRIMPLLPQGPDHVVKRLLDVDAVLGRRFDKIAAELSRQRIAFLGRHLSLGAPVALVPNEHDGRRSDGTSRERGR